MVLSLANVIFCSARDGSEFLLRATQCCALKLNDTLKNYCAIKTTQTEEKVINLKLRFPCASRNCIPFPVS